jgi:tRNA G37 N-methylase Trm5
MFSCGNITEKMRISKFNCENQVVLDLFAGNCFKLIQYKTWFLFEIGIGYFTLPYIIHAKALKVIACEWNPVAIEALKRNLELNKCSDIYIYKCIFWVLYI